MVRRAGWLGAALLLCLGLPVHAHNGALATAVPVQGIRVDGDLSDWPEGMEVYPIALVQAGDPPQSPGDYQGGFRIGYSEAENALYLAVKVRDESVVEVARGAADWNTQDGIEFFVDAAHAAGRAIGVYTVRAIGSGAWAGEAKAAHFHAVMRSGERFHTCEVRVDIGEKTEGRVRLRPGMALGFDVAVCERDEDGSFAWISWGPFGRKFESSERIGDLVLAAGEPRGARKVERGRLSGRVRWAGSPEGVAHARVQIQYLADSGRPWRQWVEADAKGEWSAEVPPGTCRVQLKWPGRGELEQRVAAVRRGGETQVDLSAPAPRGVRVPAGPGKGYWEHLSVVDGLAAQRVITLFQSRSGHLWVGTASGLSRFDGGEFATFAALEGLENRRVLRVFEDRSGTLWVGAEQGWGEGEELSRWDGRAFASADGLEGAVKAIGEGGSGHLWVGTAEGLSRWDGQTFASVDGLEGRAVKAIAGDGPEHLWVGTAEGLSRWDGQTFTPFTRADGLAESAVNALLKDRTGHLWIALENGLSRWDGQRFVSFTAEDGLEVSTVQSFVQDRHGHVWLMSPGGVSRYDGKQFKTFAAEDGLAPFVSVRAVVEDRSGNLWFATDNAVYRYDGRHFHRLESEEYLGKSAVHAMLEDREGYLWFGNDEGLSRYAGEQFRTFSTADGLAHDNILAVREDRQGNMWFTTPAGVSRYDGREFVTFAAEDGLGTRPGALFQDSRGDLWLGATRYDGEHFTRYTAAEGLSEEPQRLMEDRQGRVWTWTNMDGLRRYESKSGHFAHVAELDSLGDPRLEDRQGNMWFAIWGRGVLRYDGEKVRTFTVEDGLVNDLVMDAFEDREGNLWFGTVMGLSRWDGNAFQTWTTREGLAGNVVSAIAQDREGRLFIGTIGGGLSLFDGRVFQRLSSREGLEGDAVNDLYEDRRGDMWIATENGVTRYRPHRAPPLIHLEDVVADRSYGPVKTLSLPTSQGYLSFQFRGLSLKTRPGQMAYVYRLRGHESEWRTTREEQVVYADLPRGQYVFEVHAVDRDLTYSERPATVEVRVHLPYGQFALGGGLAVALLGLAFVSGVAVRRRRAFLREQQARLQAQEALNRELEEELQTARQMQVSLMPAESPQVEGLDIAGRCQTVNHVGGDFFQYFPQNGRLSVCLADVTGHAMEAAIPVVMFNGILESQMEQGGTLDQLFARVNRSLHRTRMNHRTFVCFCMGELDLSSRLLRLANAGCPYPYHYRASGDQVAELQLDAYPLGVRPETAYPVAETQLAPGDCLVFCSDGIIEAANTEGAIFGFERTAETIRLGCREGLSAGMLIDRLLGAVEDFVGDASPGDDMTIVVVKVGAQEE